MKFRKQKVSSLRYNGSEVWFIETGEEEFKIVSAPEGIYISGKSPWIKSVSELEDFAKNITEAFKEAKALKLHVTNSIIS